MKRPATLALALLLLAGCKAPSAPPPAVSAPEPDPAVSEPEPAPSVAAHWDMLPEPKPPTPYISNHWYDEDPADLVPSPDYGELLPYLGGEAYDYMGGGLPFTYGLANRNGVIVTAPSFAYVGPVRCYLDDRWMDTGLYLLRTGNGTRADGTLTDLMGFAPRDGSWYTGQIYTQFIDCSQYGALMLERDGSLVMLNWDMTERFRFAADDNPLPGFSAETYEFESPWVDGPYLRHVTDYREDGSATAVYLDLRDGSLLDTAPAGYFTHVSDLSEPDYPDDEFWYKWEQPTLTIHTADGVIHTITGIPCYYVEIRGDRVLFRTSNNEAAYTVTDLDGNVIFTCQRSDLSFLSDADDSLLTAVLRSGSEWLPVLRILDRDGNPIATTVYGSAAQYGDRLVFADDASYRVTDLAGNDLLRLPRLRE